MTVAETGNPIFAPTIGPGAGMIMRKIVPSVAIRAVVFANRAPLAFGKIRTPTFPVDGPASADRLGGIAVDYTLRWILFRLLKNLLQPEMQPRCRTANPPDFLIGIFALALLEALSVWFKLRSIREISS